MKKLVKIVALVLAIFVVVAVAVPFFIDVNYFRPTIESQLSSALGRQVTVGNLSLSLLTGSMGANDIAIADDPKFETQPFITAKSLKVGVELAPLIFSKQLNITGISLVQPQIVLLSAPDNTWNFSSLGAPAAKKQAPARQPGAAAPPSLSVAKLEVKNGTVTVGRVNSPAKPQVFNKVNLKVANFSFTSPFPFTLTAELPGGGDAAIDGTAGPINPNDTAKTPFQTKVKVHDLNLASSGFIDPGSGLAGLANFDGTLNSNGRMARATGVLVGKSLKLSPRGSPASIPVTVQHVVDVDLLTQRGTISQGDIAIGGARAHLTGTFQTQDETKILNLSLHAPGMPVDDLEALLPSLAIVLPSGSHLRGGTLSTDLSIVGPADRLVIAGPVRLANSKLAGFNLGQKLGSLSSFAGRAVSNPDTSIQNFGTDLHTAPGGTQLNGLNLTVPALGVITGAGAISPSGALNFHLLANLKGGVMGAFTQFASAASGRNGIPFYVQGTTSNPDFRPDMKGMTGNLAQSTLQQALQGGKGSSKGSSLGGWGQLLGGFTKRR